jgi:hypothetical protein
MEFETDDPQEKQKAIEICDRAWTYSEPQNDHGEALERMLTT